MRMNPKNVLLPYLRQLKSAHRFSSASLYFAASEIAAQSNPDSFLGKEHSELEALLKKEDGPDAEVVSYFVAQLFVGRIASFEVFLQDTIYEVVKVHPKKVGKVKFDLSDILDAPGVPELVQHAADFTINRLMYLKPLEYLAGVCDLLSIDATRLVSDWPLFVEAKARRDLGMHNDWRCNSIYERKVKEAGLECAFRAGESTAPRKEYVTNVGHSLTKLAELITRMTMEKHWPEYASAVK